MIVARLHHYVIEQQIDWDQFFKPLKYAYSVQVYRSTGTTPFSLVFSRHTLGLPCRICHRRSGPTRHHHLSPVHFSSAPCENSPSAEHVPAEDWKTLKLVTSDIFTIRLASAQRSYRANTYSSIAGLISSRHPLVSPTSQARSYN